MEPINNTGLSLSGGGFRATLFHLGAVRRLNEMAVLPEIGTISSVSGGSILAGVLAARWRVLDFQNGIATNFQEAIAEPIWQFCSRNVDMPAILLGLIAGTWKLEQSYKQLVGNMELKDLPEQPTFIFNAAHIETGRNCTISRKGIHTWRLGDCSIPNLPIAKAIAASSACPPAFPPVILKIPANSFAKSDHADLFQRNDLKEKLSLTDGGAYDNLGFHAIRNCKTILVSDAGSPLRATHGRRWARQFNHRFMRPMETAVEQTRATRRTAIMDQLLSGRKTGCLWDIRTGINDYPIQIPLPTRPEWNHYLSSVRTRLNAFTDPEKGRLINWGYLLCDLSMRSYYKKSESPPDSLPFPQYSLDNYPPRSERTQ